MDDHNNFYCWLPGQMYRQEGMIGVRYDGRAIQLRKDIDRIIEETGFDLKRFTEIQDNYREVSSRGITIAIYKKGRDDPRLEEIAAEEKVYLTMREQMVKPLYERLIGLGYTKKELEQ